MAVGILLVGGFGTRLLPLTNKTPKPMLPIANLPVTEHQLLAAKAAGITKVVLATAYLAETLALHSGNPNLKKIRLVTWIRFGKRPNLAYFHNKGYLFDDIFDKLLVDQ
jgi:NDP-sugar pyrophosphorylase family protein